MRKSEIEKALRIKEGREVRKKNITEYFQNFSRFHCEWLTELAEKYKSRGVFPLIPMYLLPSYYSDGRDKEVAAFAALLISDSSDFSRIQAFRKMLGERPWEWFEKREFVRLSLGREQHKRTGGVEHWKIANLFNRLWDECYGLTYEIPSSDTNETLVMPIGVHVESIAKAQGCSYFDVLTYLLNDCCVGDYFYKLRLLLVVLGSSGGLGLGLWKIGREELRCPLSSGLRAFISAWFPDYRKVCSIDEAISLFGFESDADFFYAWLAYTELQKSDPKACAYYSTRYTVWYGLGTRKGRHVWRGMQPKIPF